MGSEGTAGTAGAGAAEDVAAVVDTLEGVLAEALKRSDRAEQTLRHQDRELASLRAELATVYGSKTWRWTEPVRVVLRSLGLIP